MLAVSTCVDLSFNKVIDEDQSIESLYRELLTMVGVRKFPKKTIDIDGTSVSVYVELPDPNDDGEWGEIDPWFELVVEADFIENWERQLTRWIKSRPILTQTFLGQVNAAIEEMNSIIGKKDGLQILKKGDGFIYDANIQCCIFSEHE